MGKNEELLKNVAAKLPIKDGEWCGFIFVRIDGHLGASCASGEFSSSIDIEDAIAYEADATKKMKLLAVSAARTNHTHHENMSKKKEIRDNDV